MRLRCRYRPSNGWNRGLALLPHMARLWLLFERRLSLPASSSSTRTAGAPVFVCVGGNRRRDRHSRLPSRNRYDWSCLARHTMARRVICGIPRSERLLAAYPSKASCWFLRFAEQLFRTVDRPLFLRNEKRQSMIARPKHRRTRLRPMKRLKKVVLPVRRCGAILKRLTQDYLRKTMGDALRRTHYCFRSEAGRRPA